MRFSWQKLLVVLIALPILAYVVLEAKNLIFYFSNQRDPVAYVLPDGLSGWVVIEYNPDCPPVEESEHTLTYFIPKDGWLCVAGEPIRQGFAQDQIVYQSEPKNNLLQHPGSRMNRVWYDRTWQRGDSRFLAFYVGYEVFKKDQPQLFLQLENRLKAKGQDLPTSP